MLSETSACHSERSEESKPRFFGPAALRMTLSEKCHFTATETRQLSEWLTDLGRKGKEDAGALLQNGEIASVLQYDGLSPKEKGRRVLRIIRDKCYPHLVRAEKIWAEGIERLDRPKDIWIPLTRAIESSRLEDALECSSDRRRAGEEWISKHRLEIENILKQIHEIS